MILRCRVLLLIFFVTSPAVALETGQHHNQGADSSPPLVVTTIRPLHSLLSHIMLNVSEPEILLDRNQSPHHYSLRPSQRRTLNQADIFFWVGEALETFMPRVLNALPDKVQAIELIDDKRLHLLEPRFTKDPHHSHDHGHGNEHNIDPHIWLSVDNAIVIASKMTDTLSKADPSRQLIYQKNLKQLKQNLQQLKTEIKHALTQKTFNYLVYHDAFQYFETELEISPLAAISTDEEQSPGIKHLSYINKLVNNKKINCLFYNTTTLPSIARNLVEEKKIQPIYIEPLGNDFDTGADLYFNLMRSLLSGYQQCARL